MSEKPTGMTSTEKQAYDWAIKQMFQSVSADYARKLAQYIERSHKQLEEAHVQVDKWIKEAGDLQTDLAKLEELKTALVMSDEEMNAYEWCIEQGPQAVAGDYACRLAQYIRNVKLAYRKDSAEERNCDTCAITGLLCPIRNDDPPFTFPCPHWKSLAEEQGDD